MQSDLNFTFEQLPKLVVPVWICLMLKLFKRTTEHTEVVNFLLLRESENVSATWHRFFFYPAFHISLNYIAHTGRLSSKNINSIFIKITFHKTTFRKRLNKIHSAGPDRHAPARKHPPPFGPDLRRLFPALTPDMTVLICGQNGRLIVHGAAERATSVSIVGRPIHRWAAETAHQLNNEYLCFSFSCRGWIIEKMRHADLRVSFFVSLLGFRWLIHDSWFFSEMLNLGLYRELMWFIVFAIAICFISRMIFIRWKFWFIAYYAFDLKKYFFRQEQFVIFFN